MIYVCDVCGRETTHPKAFNNLEMVYCPACFRDAEARGEMQADYEYERMKEEGLL